MKTKITFPTKVNWTSTKLPTTTLKQEELPKFKGFILWLLGKAERKQDLIIMMMGNKKGWKSKIKTYFIKKGQR